MTDAVRCALGMTDAGHYFNPRVIEQITDGPTVLVMTEEWPISK
jgi:hypothetical protein